MQLLPAELRAQIPPLYSKKHVKLDDKTVYAKFFFPAGNWTWFVTEGDDDDGDFRMFGFVIGIGKEWGYFSLNELEAIEVNGLTVERDINFQPRPFSKVVDRERDF